MSLTIGSILHGAYGDYYEQLVALRGYKRLYPNRRLILFFATISRFKEMAVFDMSFADEIHPPTEITRIHVDAFFQFQVRDKELQQFLDTLPESVRKLIDRKTLNRPWSWVRRLWRKEPELCDIGLSQAGREALPKCMAENGVDESIFPNRFTVGFLWRYRASTGYITSRGQPPENVVRATKGALLKHYLEQNNAAVLIAGMNLVVNESNRERTDCKFSNQTLPVSGDCLYLKGLSWGLELEIMRRCTLCFVMASGFSEALWLKRRGVNTFMVDPPRSYLLKLVYHRMPFFSILKLGRLSYNWVNTHTPERVMSFVKRNADPQLRAILETSPS
jgi:hypothetical protein